MTHLLDRHCTQEVSFVLCEFLCFTFFLNTIWEIWRCHLVLSNQETIYHLQPSPISYSKLCQTKILFVRSVWQSLLLKNNLINCFFLLKIAVQIATASQSNNIWFQQFLTTWISVSLSVKTLRHFFEKYRYKIALHFWGCCVIMNFQ